MSAMPVFPPRTPQPEAPPALTLAAVLGPGPRSLAEGLPRLLDFLCQVSDTAPRVHAVLAVSTAHHEALLAALPPTLENASHADHWPKRLPDGFHRLDLGHWLITLCVGPLAHSLAQWHCTAQHLWVGGAWPGHDTPLGPLARPLARHCALHATLHLEPTEGAGTDDDWTHAGFQPLASVGGTPQTWRYQPRWPVAPVPPAPTRTALVIGAGLAGAAACASLTRRGWQVVLLDEAEGPAQGASGLPVGMLSEHRTARDTVLSRLSRSGMALHWRELQRRVPQGQGWHASLVTNLRHGSDDEPDAHDTPPDNGPTAPTCAPAAIVRPAALVNAWLDQAQATGLLQCRWRSHVATLARAPGGTDWQALDAQGQPLAQAAHVVVAAAHGGAALLRSQGQSLPTGDTLRPVKGQLSFARLVGPPLAPNPLRDHGVYVPCFEDAANPLGQRLWAMGSTYERGQNNHTVTPQGHERNAASLKNTLPCAHALFERQWADGELQGWAQVRCASLDRLPLIGAVPALGPLRASMQLAQVPREPGLWALCALGSRGLTLSLLGAELLVAQMAQEPWPTEKELALALDPARFALKHARKFSNKTPLGA